MTAMDNYLWVGIHRTGRHPGYKHRRRPDGTSYCGLAHPNSPWIPATDTQLTCTRCTRCTHPAEHGTTAGYRAGCRCQPCTTANSTRRRALKWDAVERRRDTGEEPSSHGRYSYINNGCRCDTCTEDHRRVIREARNRRAAHRTLIDGRLVSTVAPEHGKSSTYENYKCRCQPCTTASTRNRTPIRKD